MLEDAEPGCWERLVVEGGDYAPVEEATAEPGRVRRTGRKGVAFNIDPGSVPRSAR